MKRIALFAAALFAATPALAQIAPTYQSQDGQSKEGVGTFPVRGSSSLFTGQATAGTGPTLIVPARANRSVVILNVMAANTCTFGPSGVTSTTGLQLQPVAGASVTLATAAAIYAVCSASTAISFGEMF